MNKLNRKIVYDKFGGKCAFCGYDLVKGWHVWDIEPIGIAVSESGSLVKTNTEIENLMPACKSCGSTRAHKSGNTKMNIEKFRKDLQSCFEFLRDGGVTGAYYRKSIRFGLIEETGKDVVFYFETIKVS